MSLAVRQTHVRSPRSPAAIKPQAGLIPRLQAAAASVSVPSGDFLRAAGPAL